VEGTSKEGKVKVTYNGQQKPMGVQIEETYFQSLKSNKDGADELSDALSQAMEEAHSKSAAKMEEKLKSLYSDLGFESS
jgi:DNA-binding protein YbaB